MLVDSHAHLNSGQFRRDLPEVLERARAAGVTRILVVGYDIESSRRAAELAGQYEGLYASVGIHPHDAKAAGEDTFRLLRDLAKAPGVVALGEMGLDYYRDLSPRRVQAEVFRRQLRLARELGLPVIIHDRDAHEPVLRILDEEGPLPASVVMHCFSGDRNVALRCLERGYYVSFAGPITSPRAPGLRNAARAVPLDRLLVETDAPYLAPEPHRGRRNEPACVREVALAVARAKGVDPEAVAESTTANACAVFGLPRD